MLFFSPSPADRVAICLFLMGLLVGCNISLEQDPAETVNLEISGISQEADRKMVQEKLQKMTDSGNYLFTSSYSGNKMSISLSPVTDVEAFATKIDFGNVINVDVANRTVEVEFTP